MRMAGGEVGGVHWCAPKRTSAEEPWLQCLDPFTGGRAAAAICLDGRSSYRA